MQRKKYNPLAVVIFVLGLGILAAAIVKSRMVGIGAAAANWAVARLLLEPSEHNAAIRLAYIHNLGDVWVSLAPVAASLLLILTGNSLFDPLIAGEKRFGSAA